MVAAIIPSERDADDARRAVQLLRQHQGANHTVVVQGAEPTDAPVRAEIPREAFDLLLQILGHMANGDAITLMPVHKRLTTQEAANILGVSRPYLIRLLDQGLIPFEKTGAHRRIRATDLLEYKRADAARRDQALADLVAETEKLGLEY